MSVHAVFPYGGVRAPLYEPLLLQGLVSLAAAPPRYNTAPMWPPQPPTGPASLSRGKTGTKPALST